jgi:hypothetical protein
MAGVAMLTKEQILAAQSWKVETLHIPGLGVVGIRALTGAELGKYQARRISIVGNEQHYNLEGAAVELVTMCLCDLDGNRLFTDRETNEVGKLPADIIRRIADAATDLNGLSENAVEDAEKN